MKTGDYTMKNVLLTFAIGFCAGITPFAFTRVLPMMLRPEEFIPMQPLHFWILIGGMVITGLIVGVIITLLYAGTSDEMSPKEVFLYALGIPAILVTTVTNFTADQDAKSEISAMQATANAVISNPAPASPQIPEQTFKSLTGVSERMDSGFFVATAHAATAADHPTVLAQSQKSRYLVIIGTYASREEAQGAFEQYMNRKFRSEAYVPKRLEILEQPGQPPQYVIVYSRFDSAAEATRASRYLSVNDRDLAVRLAKQSR